MSLAILEHLSAYSRTRWRCPVITSRQLVLRPQWLLGVGRPAADLLLSRRNRYRQVYGADVRLVTVCSLRSGLADVVGPVQAPLDVLGPGLSGSKLRKANGADVLVVTGPSGSRTGGPANVYLRSSHSFGRDTIVSKSALVDSGPASRANALSLGAIMKLSGAAAALPTVDLLEQSLKGCEVLICEGINNTTNYLLDAMMKQGLSFDEALDRVQAGGFTEADPRNDTAGWDTATTLLILANLGLDGKLTMDDVTVEGSHSITEQRIVAWRRQRLASKLSGRFIRGDGALGACVGVRVYPLTDPLAHVAGKNMAVRITTDAIGEANAIEAGSEPLATAVAALKDLEHILIVTMPLSAPLNEDANDERTIEAARHIGLRQLRSFGEFGLTRAALSKEALQ